MSHGARFLSILRGKGEHEYWGTQNPIGQQLHFAGPTPRTVIGIVGDVRHEGLNGGTKPEMYVPVEQAPRTEGGPMVVVRTSVNSGVAAAELRAAVSAIDYAIPVDRIETMDQLVSGSVAQPRFRTIMFATFSLLALVMASIGIYGVMNYLVIQRMREFGIRLSLGATRMMMLAARWPDQWGLPGIRPCISKRVEPGKRSTHTGRSRGIRPFRR
jgi:hypothetical protein